MSNRLQKNQFAFLETAPSSSTAQSRFSHGGRRVGGSDEEAQERQKEQAEEQVKTEDDEESEYISLLVF